jgi:hypothetical protein
MTPANRNKSFPFIILSSLEILNYTGCGIMQHFIGYVNPCRSLYETGTSEATNSICGVCGKRSMGMISSI